MCKQKMCKHWLDINRKSRNGIQSAGPRFTLRFSYLPHTFILVMEDLAWEKYCRERGTRRHECVSPCSLLHLWLALMIVDPSQK